MKNIYFSILFLLGLASSIQAQNFNLTFRSEIEYPYSCASIWGYVDDDETEYALVGTYQGVSIVDVSNPDLPVVKFNVDHTFGEWREIKTYGHYAYATNEGGGGLLVIDLSGLPSSVQSYSFIYTDDIGHTQDNGHTLWIDENGKLYIFGGGYEAGGATIFDLNTDPINPAYLGKYEQHYIHDGFVRGDTLWASEIYEGKLEMVNVSNPANCVPMASVITTSAFTHNAWPTHDNHYVFTTDEVDNSYLTSYDVSEFSNITQLDKVQSNPGSGVIIHNVHLFNDQFAVVAYYKDGVVLFDVSHPDNMIEVGSYDTDPNESGGSYGGTWGVYPYLPSGNIIASDLWDAGTPNGKLTILTPDVSAACWLEGTVTDSITGAPVNNTLVEILTTEQNDNSDLSGIYKTGNGIAGTYTVRYTAFGYVVKEVQNVILTNGITNNLDVQLAPLATLSATGTVLDSNTNQPVPSAQVFFTDLNGITFDVVTDVSGNFTVAPIYEGSYDVFAGKWGYHEKGIYNTIVNQNSLPLQLLISNGYYDDFILNNDWSVTTTATTGIWERGEPIGTDDGGGTTYNPEFDVTGDWGDYCYVTGNGGGGVGDDDVDNGKTTLTSPMMDLSNYEDPVISFYSWFVNGGGSGNANDTLKVYLTDGNSTVLLANIRYPMSQWVLHQYHVSDFLAPNSTMQVSFVASDLQSSGHLVEAAIDKFEVFGDQSTGISSVDAILECNIYPNPFTDKSYIQYHFNSETIANARIEIFSTLGQLVETHLLATSNGTVEWGKHLNDGLFIVKFMNDSGVIKVISAVKTK